jgi:hypothetical protein
LFVTASFSEAESLYLSDDVAQPWRRIDGAATAESRVMTAATHPTDEDSVFCHAVRAIDRHG